MDMEGLCGQFYDCYHCHWRVLGMVIMDLLCRILSLWQCLCPRKFWYGFSSWWFYLNILGPQQRRMTPLLVRSFGFRLKWCTYNHHHLLYIRPTGPCKMFLLCFNGNWCSTQQHTHALLSRILLLITLRTELTLILSNIVRPFTTTWQLSTIKSLTSEILSWVMIFCAWPDHRPSSNSCIHLWMWF
jgi:hypothetical protein